LSQALAAAEIEMVIQLSTVKFGASKSEIICHDHHFTLNSLTVLTEASVCAVVAN
jgi:hypothetical protein